MALTTKQLGNAILTALRNNSAILNKCLEYYYHAHSVMYGSTGSKTPTVDELPAFSIVPWSKERGEDDSDRVYHFSIVLTLHDDTVSSTTTEKGIVVKSYRGSDTLEELLDLAYTAIKAISTELFFNALSFEYEPIEYYPLFVGQIVMEISYPVLIGQYEPTV